MKRLIPIFLSIYFAAGVGQAADKTTNTQGLEQGNIGIEAKIKESWKKRFLPSFWWSGERHAVKLLASSHGIELNIFDENTTLALSYLARDPKFVFIVALVSAGGIITSAYFAGEAITQGLLNAQNASINAIGDGPTNACDSMVVCSPCFQFDELFSGEHKPPELSGFLEEAFQACDITSPQTIKTIGDFFNLSFNQIINRYSYAPTQQQWYANNTCLSQDHLRAYVSVIPNGETYRWPDGTSHFNHNFHSEIAFFEKECGLRRSEYPGAIAGLTIFAALYATACTYFYVWMFF